MFAKSASAAHSRRCPTQPERFGMAPLNVLEVELAPGGPPVGRGGSDATSVEDLDRMPMAILFRPVGVGEFDRDLARPPRVIADRP